MCERGDFITARANHNSRIVSKRSDGLAHELCCASPFRSQSEICEIARGFDRAGLFNIRFAFREQFRRDLLRGGFA